MKPNYHFASVGSFVLVSLLWVTFPAWAEVPVVVAAEARLGFALPQSMEPFGGQVVVRPEGYPLALRNPHKGFTNRGFRENNRWATLVHHYIPWNQIENSEGDGIDKIRDYCDRAWKGLPQGNQKVIPRVYLHWSGDRKYWPADMTPDDYTSEQFVRRAIRWVERLGICWNEDPRVAHVELGMIGKWGEHHSPAPTLEVQRVLGEAFQQAFPNKQVLVRHVWSEFLGFGFGGYWDSWAHANQMNSHGAGLAELGDHWRTRLVGGETAYDWGRFREQPGDNPTDTMIDPVHRRFLIDTIRSLHCTQLRWVSDYDQDNEQAQAGAEEVQRAFGYRYVVTGVRYPAQIERASPFEVSFDVINIGSAPFYYEWPVELSLVAPDTGEVVWRALFTEADLREWMPGEDWNTEQRRYRQPPEVNRISGSFQLDASVPTGEYRLTLAVLDPAGQLPSLRFAIRNYQRGGRHPIGMVGVERLPKSLVIPLAEFDDPDDDQTLHYLLFPQD